jgi:hypothetical protein
MYVYGFLVQKIVFCYQQTADINKNKVELINCVFKNFWTKLKQKLPTS